MEQTKVKFPYYEQPKNLEKIDECIELIAENEGEKISRASFIRRAVAFFIKHINSIYAPK